MKIALLSGLDKLRFCPLGAIGSRGTACSPVTDLQAVVMLFGGFCRLFLFIGRYFILCFADIFPCFLERLLTLLVELVDTLVLDTVSSVGKPVPHGSRTLEQMLYSTLSGSRYGRNPYPAHQPSGY